MSREQLREGSAPSNRNFDSTAAEVCVTVKHGLRLAVRVARPGLLGAPGLVFLVTVSAFWRGWPAAILGVFSSVLRVSTSVLLQSRCEDGVSIGSLGQRLLCDRRRRVIAYWLETSVRPQPGRDRAEGEGEPNLSNATLAKLVVAALLLSAFTIWRSSDRIRGACHRHCPTDFSAIRR